MQQAIFAGNLHIIVPDCWKNEYKVNINEFQSI